MADEDKPEKSDRLKELDETLAGMPVSSENQFPTELEAEKPDEDEEDGGDAKPVELEDDADGDDDGKSTEDDEKPTTPTDDELEAELLAVEKPQPDHWKRMRELFGRMKDGKAKSDEEMQAIRTELEELKTKPAEAPKGGSGEEEEDEVEPHTVFQSIVKARQGEFGTENQNAEVETQALRVLKFLKPAEILTVIDDAAAGKYGAYSADMQKIAKDALVESNARHNVAVEEQTEQAKQDQETLKKYNAENVKSFSKVIEAEPDLGVEDSDKKKYFDQWWKENVREVDDQGKTIKEGPLFSMLQNPKFPEKMLPYFQNAYKTRETDGSEAVRLENEKLKKEKEDRASLHVANRSGSSGHQTKPGEKPGKSQRTKELEKKMSGMRVSPTT